MQRLIFAAALAAAAAFRPPTAARIAHQPRRPAPCSKTKRVAAALSALAKDDQPEEDTEEIKELRERMLAEELRARAGELTEGGSNRLAAQWPHGAGLARLARRSARRPLDARSV